MHVYRTIADPKSRVEIVCVEQVVGVAIFRSMRAYGGGNCLLAPFFSLARTIADPKSRVEIVCVEQVVGVYARQAMMTCWRVCSSGYDDVRKHRLVLFPISLWLRAIFRSMRTYGGGNCLLAPFFSLVLVKPCLILPWQDQSCICDGKLGLLIVGEVRTLLTSFLTCFYLGNIEPTSPVHAVTTFSTRAVMFLTSDNISSGAIVVVDLHLGAMTDKLRKNRVNFRQNVSASLDQIFFSSDNSRERPELDDVLSLSFPPDISGRGSNLCGSAKTTATCSARDAEAVSFMEEMVEARGSGAVANRHRKAQNFRAHSGDSVKSCLFTSPNPKLPCQVEEMAEAVRMARLYGAIETPSWLRARGRTSA
ncbi:hypothetical protein Bca4012_048611 [Brassica carinata]